MPSRLRAVLSKADITLKFSRTALVVGALVVGALVAPTTETHGARIASVNGTVRALTVFQGDLIAGGDFTMAGSAPAQHVARWDGTRWHALASGTGGPVHALAAFDDKLFVGGAFATAGGAAASNVAQWDGASWSPLGSGTDGPVRALATFLDFFVYAGGAFGDAGGVPANNVAEWFNGSWRAMGAGLDGEVGCLTVLNSTVVAAGNFAMVGQSIGQIASFSPLGWVLENEAIQDGLIHSVANANGTLVAGGNFRQVWWQTRGISVGRKVGPRWQPLSLGLSRGALLEPGDVFAIAPYADGVAAGGLFTLADGLAASNVAFFDGTVWTPLGAGVDGEVLALVEYGGDLVVGGAFATAGGLEATNIASWDGVAWSNELTPLALEDLTIHTADRDVLLEWRLPEATLHTWREVVVQRGASPHGPFRELGVPLVPARAMRWRDADIEPGRVFWYRLRFDAWHGPSAFLGPVRVESTGVETAQRGLRAVDLGPGQPVQIRYRLARASEIRLTLYDVRGRLVRLLHAGVQPAGEHVRIWNRSDSIGRPVARGAYFVHLDNGRTQRSERFVLVSR